MQICQDLKSEQKHKKTGLEPEEQESQKIYDTHLELPSVYLIYSG